MEKNDLNKSMCEELFGGKLEVTLVPDCFEKSEARQQKNCQKKRQFHLSTKRFPNNSVQYSACSVSSHICFNSCSTSAIPSLFGRNMSFLFRRIHPSSEPFPQPWKCGSSQSEGTRIGSTSAASLQTSQSNRVPASLPSSLRTIPRTCFYLNHSSPCYSHDQLRKYKVRTCRAPHAEVRPEYSRRRTSFLETP